MRRQDDGDEVTVGRRRLEQLRDDGVRRRIAAFGGGLYALGPRQGLMGRPAAALPRERGVRAILDAPGRYASVDPGARTIPVDVTGRIEGGRRAAARWPSP